MANLTKAQQARADKFLNKLVRTEEWGVITYRKWLENFKNDGGCVEESEQPSIKYNRVKYNRMNWDEQREYDEKLKVMKPLYKLKRKPEDNSFWEISKTEFDYFNSL